jgi:hypothetical protein
MMLVCALLAFVGTGCGRRVPPVAELTAVTARLVQIASVPVAKAREITFLGDHAFVSQNLEGMTLVHIADPRNPRIVRQFEPGMMQPLFAKALEPSMLLVADRFRGLGIWDVADPEAPTSVSETLLSGIATHLDIFRDGESRFAAVACGGAGLAIVDITSPTLPQIAGRATKGTDYARRVLVRNRIGFLADNFDGGMKVFDLSVPADPRPFYQVRIRGFCDSVDFRDNVLFAAYRTYGTRLFRLNDEAGVADDRPATPSLTHLCTLFRSNDHVRNAVPVDDDLLVVANDESGIDLYDVTNPSAPVLVDIHRTSGTAMSAAQYRGIVYVTAWDQGILVFDVKHGGDAPSAGEPR